MYSIAFPKMFKSSRTLLLKDKDAVRSHIQLFLASEKRTLFGDPEYGVSLRSALFEQNTSIVKDLIIDELFTGIQVFVPLVRVNRDDIDVISRGADLIATLKVTYALDNTTDLFEIRLTATSEE